MMVGVRKRRRKRKFRSPWSKLASLGGQARARKLSPEERRRIALLGVEARRKMKQKPSKGGS